MAIILIIYHYISYNSIVIANFSNLLFLYEKNLYRLLFHVKDIVLY